MVLNFLGSGSGFADEHTSAWFDTENRELVIIDCSMLNVQKLKRMDLSHYDDIYVLVTHTHGDHTSGLGLWAQYAYFTLGTEITIIAPCERVKKDLQYLLQEIEGCDQNWYEIYCADELHLGWLGRAILTTHSPQLEGKCFGYRLVVDGKNIVYTGDTSSLAPFIPYLTDGCELYVDISVHYGMIHLKLDEILSKLTDFASKGVHIYLMHLDDKLNATEIVKDIPNIEVI